MNLTFPQARHLFLGLGEHSEHLPPHGRMGKLDTTEPEAHAGNLIDANDTRNYKKEYQNRKHRPWDQTESINQKS